MRWGRQRTVLMMFWGTGGLEGMKAVLLRMALKGSKTWTRSVTLSAARTGPARRCQPSVGDTWEGPWQGNDWGARKTPIRSAAVSAARTPAAMQETQICVAAANVHKCEEDVHHGELALAAHWTEAYARDH